MTILTQMNIRTVADAWNADSNANKKSNTDLWESEKHFLCTNSSRGGTQLIKGQTSNNNFEFTDRPQQVRVTVSFGWWHLRIAVLLVKHSFRRGELHWQRTYPSHSILFVRIRGLIFIGHVL
ncbi:hypothetical protein ABZX51_006105 [Aspergillus tubingensis]